MTNVRRAYTKTYVIIEMRMCNIVGLFHTLSKPMLLKHSTSIMKSPLFELLLMVVPGFKFNSNMVRCEQI